MNPAVLAVCSVLATARVCGWNLHAVDQAIQAGLLTDLEWAAALALMARVAA